MFVVSTSCQSLAAACRSELCALHAATPQHIQCRRTRCACGRRSAAAMACVVRVRRMCSSCRRHVGRSLLLVAVSCARCMLSCPSTSSVDVHVGLQSSISCSRGVWRGGAAVSQVFVVSTSCRPLAAACRSELCALHAAVPQHIQRRRTRCACGRRSAAAMACAVGVRRMCSSCRRHVSRSLLLVAVSCARCMLSRRSTSSVDVHGARVAVEQLPCGCVGCVRRVDVMSVARCCLSQ